MLCSFDCLHLFFTVFLDDLVPFDDVGVKVVLYIGADTLNPYIIGYFSRLMKELK